jgi:nicotinate (nicotinamide) nucleotide adenylyltransferase
MSKEKVVLALCGTFNPITYLHLRLFEVARDWCNDSARFSVVGGIISPVHDSYKKHKPSVADGHHRLKMCHLGVEESKWLRVSDWEMNQKDWSPSLVALTGLQEHVRTFQDWKDAQVKFLCGADLLESFAVPDLWDPNDIRNILEKYELLVVSREGSDPEKFIQSSELLKELKDHIHLMTNEIPNDISSTKIRSAVAHGKSIRYLLPDTVMHYIQENKLYKS